MVQEVVVDFAERWELAQREYAGKVRTFARNSYRQITGYTQEDVEQELLVVLWQTVLAYDPDKGATFNTLFQTNAKNKVIGLIRMANTKSRRAIVHSIDEDAMRAAVESFFATGGAEDSVMARLDLEELVERHGSRAVLRGGKRLRDEWLAAQAS